MMGFVYLLDIITANIKKDLHPSRCISCGSYIGCEIEFVILFTRLEEDLIFVPWSTYLLYHMNEYYMFTKKPEKQDSKNHLLCIDSYSKVYEEP